MDLEIAGFTPLHTSQAVDRDTFDTILSISRFSNDFANAPAELRAAFESKLRQILANPEGCVIKRFDISDFKPHTTVLNYFIPNDEARSVKLVHFKNEEEEVLADSEGNIIFFPAYLWSNRVLAGENGEIVSVMPSFRTSSTADSLKPEDIIGITILRGEFTEED